MSRRTDRQHAFCLIFLLEFAEETDMDILFKKYTEHHVDEGEAIDSAFVFEEFSGVCKNLEKIDEIISETLKAWTTDRLNKVDLALLRLAVYEICFNDKIPASVSINEAVELAKLYGEDEAPGFINAILGAALKMINEGGDLNPC